MFIPSPMARAEETGSDVYAEKLRTAIGMARAMDAEKIDEVIGFLALRGERFLEGTRPTEYAAEVKADGSGVRVVPVRFVEWRAIVARRAYA